MYNPPDMGFIENLRRIIAAEQAESQRLIDERVRADALVAQQREAESRAKQQEAQRKQDQISDEKLRAEVFLRSSAFPNLIQELASLLNASTIINRALSFESESLWGNRKVSDSVSFLHEHGEASLLESKPNVAGMGLIWLVGKRREHEKRNSVHEWENIYNAIAVAFDHLGNITLVSSGRNILLGPSGWRGNPDIQEESLGRAYSNPRRFYAKKETWITPPPSWDPYRFGNGGIR